MASGSKGNALWVQAGKTRVLVDLGLGPRQLAARAKHVGADVRSLAAVLLSHDHSDHISGVGKLLGNLSVPLFTHHLVAGRAAGPSWGTKELGHLEGFEVGGLKITPFALPHDAPGTCGFVFEYEGRKAAHLTDLGHVPAQLPEWLSEVELLSVESNHDLQMLETGPYPWFLKKRVASDVGHLSNDACGKLLATLARKGRLKHAVLAHLSETNNTPQKAFACAKKYLKGTDVGLSLSCQWDTSSVFTLGEPQGQMALRGLGRA
ncbi:MAG: MBL fold metallo-hydrolase [Bdellovibrionota bacterium]